MRCPNCNNEVENGAKFCGNCGALLATAPAEQTEPKAKKPVSMPKLPVKKIVVGVAALLVVVLLFTLVSAMFSGGKESVYYVKDNEIFLNDSSKNAPYQVTSRLLSNGYISSSDMISQSYSLGVVLSENEKTMLYIDRVDAYEDSVSLYYKKVKDVDEEGTKLDSDITRFSTNDSLSKVLYLKDDSLYLHDMKEKEKLSSGVDEYYASEDLSLIYFISDDGSLYQWTGKEKEKISSEVEDVYFSEDMKIAFFYTEDCSLYVKEQGKDKEKIASDVADVSVNDSNAICYKTTENTLYFKELGKDKVKVASDVYAFSVSGNGVYYYVDYKQPLLDFLENDMDDLDDEDLEDYYEDYYIWEFTTVYYFDGTNSTTLAEAGDIYSAPYNEDKSVLILLNYDMEAVGTIKMSDVIDAVGDGEYSNPGYAAEGLLEQALEDNMSVLVSVDGVVSPLDIEDVSRCRISKDGKTLYLLTELDEDTYAGDLYKAQISGTTVSAPEKVDSDVQSSYMTICDNGDVLYFKDLDDDKGELYFNGEHIASDALATYISKNDNGNFYFMTDYSSNRSQGTLNVFNGKKTETISDDVRSWQVQEDGSVVFLYDYSSTSFTGELRKYSGKKTETIDEDIAALLNVTVGACTKSFYFY